MWHVSSRSGVATLRTAIHSLLATYYVPYAGTIRYDTISEAILTRAQKVT